LHPINNADFSSALLQAQASGAKVIALANGGDDTGRALKQAREFQISPAQTVIGMSAVITDVAGLGLASAEGLLLTETFYWNLDDGTRAFGRRWAARNQGRYPTMMQAGVYAAVWHYLKALAESPAPTDGAAVVARMKAMPTDDPLFGKGTIRADGRCLHDSFVFRVKSPAESREPWDFYDLVARVPAGQSIRPLTEGGCKLVERS
jgi:branched-chain amino acid transport system substrate-binding protein